MSYAGKLQSGCSQADARLDPFLVLAINDLFGREIQFIR